MIRGNIYVLLARHCRISPVEDYRSIAERILLTVVAEMNPVRSTPW